jgi:hypothetical protein
MGQQIKKAGIFAGFSILIKHVPYHFNQFMVCRNGRKQFYLKKAGGGYL